MFMNRNTGFWFLHPQSTFAFLNNIHLNLRAFNKYILFSFKPFKYEYWRNGLWWGVGCCAGAGDGWTPDCGLQTPSPAPATSGSVVTRSQTRRRSGSRSSSATLQQITSHYHRLDTPLYSTHTTIRAQARGGPWTIDRDHAESSTL